VSSDAATVAPPAVDPTILDGSTAFQELVRKLHDAQHTHAGNLWGSSQAMVLAALERRAQGPFEVRTPDD